MSASIKKITPKKDELLFLPLGGCNEIGMNLNLYGHAGEWLMVDCGISFADGKSGVDVLLPNPEFIAYHKKNLVGLVLTHAHEDHLGAVGHLWRQFECPIYATPFTMRVLRHKLAEAKLSDKVLLHEIDMSERFSVGAFDIELITLTHSIPEPNALVIRTSAGTVMHSGDWKFDESPVVGDVSDTEALQKIGEEGVLALLCDSTNVLVGGQSESEGVIAANLKSLIGNLSGRVFTTCFASNIARLQSLFDAGEACGRRVALAGSAMHRMVKYAQETGYLSENLQFDDAELLENPNDESLLVLCTGSQGEMLAALPRIARGEHPKLKLHKGDTVIFSARTIPGNELSIAYVQNMLVRLGVDVIADGHQYGTDYGALHASGHPQQDELIRMYSLVKPHIAIPVHGEPRHLQAHAELASACQVPQSYVAQNGALLRLAEKGVEKITDVASEVLCLDGQALLPVSAAVLSERRKLAAEGAIFCSMLMEGERLSACEISLKGVGSVILPNGDIADEAEILSEVAARAYDKIIRKEPNAKNEAIGEAVRIALRRTARKRYGKNAIVTVHIIEI